MFLRFYLHTGWTGRDNIYDVDPELQNPSLGSLQHMAGRLVENGFWADAFTFVAPASITLAEIVGEDSKRGEYGPVLKRTAVA